jgi:hypothetical protein
VPFRFSVSGGDDTMSGVIDGRRTAARFEIANDYPGLGYTVNLSILVLDRKAWVKIRYKRVVRDGPKVPRAWMAMDFDRAVKLGGPSTAGPPGRSRPTPRM